MYLVIFIKTRVQGVRSDKLATDEPEEQCTCSGTPTGISGIMG